MRALTRCLLIVFVFFSLLAQANTNNNYQIELIIFENPITADSAKEHFPAHPPLPITQNTQSLYAIEEEPDEEDVLLDMPRELPDTKPIEVNKAPEA